MQDLRNYVSRDVCEGAEFIASIPHVRARTPRAACALYYPPWSATGSPCIKVNQLQFECLQMSVAKI